MRRFCPTTDIMAHRGPRYGQCVAPAPAEAIEQEVERLREALTPSAATKAAYSGEFSERTEVLNPAYDPDDEDGNQPETIIRTVPVSWTTIKAIMAAIRERAVLAIPEKEPPVEETLSKAERKAQAERCGCFGTDDYCSCQNGPDRQTIEEREALAPSLPGKEEGRG